MTRSLVGRRWLRTLAALLAIGCSGVDAASMDAANRMTGGDAERGRELVRQYGCGSCHTIPGVTGANGMVGPPLAGIASRSYIAGVLPNAPDNMLRWLRDPRAVDSLTAMPNVSVTASDARHLTAYLYTLR